MMILEDCIIMKENVIISLADSNYFELLNELVDSIKRFKESD